MLPALRLSLIGTLAFATILPAQVPTFREVSGHDFGERITQHFEMQRYLERLAESSPRVKLIRQGESWEGRALMLAIVTSPENHARLETIRAELAPAGGPAVHHRRRCGHHHHRPAGRGLVRRIDPRL